MQSQNQDNDNGRSAPFVRRATQQTSLSELWSQNISIHALREEGDVSLRRGALMICPFLSTPSARRATKGDCTVDCSVEISIHALREEGDTSAIVSPPFCLYFYPRPPRGGRREIRGGLSQAAAFLSTPSARRATGTHTARKIAAVISIHALREEGDIQNPTQRILYQHFYPRPPRGGRQCSTSGSQERNAQFLSTPSARRATQDIQCAENQNSRFLSTPSARRATLTAVTRSWFLCLFLSTPSARRATYSLPQRRQRYTISIHALREEGDTRLSRDDSSQMDFYPRPPRGGRLCAVDDFSSTDQFLSTPSARRATDDLCLAKFLSDISIHALREEGDGILPDHKRRFPLISIHALREEGDRTTQKNKLANTNFYPRPPRGGRLNISR